MFYFLSLLAGVFISVMIAINGMLTGQAGVHSATVIIHLVGLLFIAIIVLLKRQRPFAERHAWFLYLGGPLGIIVTILNNLAFGRISLSAILALILLGQAIAGLLIDQFGFLGMPKHPFMRSKLIGICIILVGIAAMIDNFEFAAIIMSFIAGLLIVATRTINAKFSSLTSIQISTFYHHLIGFILSLPILFLLGRSEIAAFEFSFSLHWYMYLGGIFGVTVILISNVVVMKISAFYLTLLLFIGQVFTGILIYMMLVQAFSPRNLIGGIIVTIGLCVNLLLDHKKAKKHHLEQVNT